MYREMVTNEDGEPLGLEYHYDDEPEPEEYDDYGPEDYEPDDYDFPDTDLMYEYESGYEEYEPSPYHGDYSEE